MRRCCICPQHTCLVSQSVPRDIKHILTCSTFRVEEIETPQIYDAWVKTLDLIEALKPSKIIPGHIEEGWELDPKADLEHSRKYIDLFAEKVTYAKKKPEVDELYETFKNAFLKVSSY